MLVLARSGVPEPEKNPFDRYEKPKELSFLGWGLDDVQVHPDKPWLITDPRFNPDTMLASHKRLTSADWLDRLNSVLEQGRSLKTYNMFPKYSLFDTFPEAFGGRFWFEKFTYQFQAEGFPNVVRFLLKEPMSVGIERLDNSLSKFEQSIRPLPKQVQQVKYFPEGQYTYNVYAQDIVARRVIVIPGDFYSLFNDMEKLSRVLGARVFNPELLRRYDIVTYEKLCQAAEVFGYSWYGDLWERLVPVPPVELLVMLEAFDLFVNFEETIFDLRLLYVRT